MYCQSFKGVGWGAARGNTEVCDTTTITKESALVHIDTSMQGLVPSHFLLRTQDFCVCFSSSCIPTVLFTIFFCSTKYPILLGTQGQHELVSDRDYRSMASPVYYPNNYSHMLSLPYHVWQALDANLSPQNLNCTGQILQTLYYQYCTQTPVLLSNITLRKKGADNCDLTCFGDCYDRQQQSI